MNILKSIRSFLNPSVEELEKQLEKETKRSEKLQTKAEIAEKIKEQKQKQKAARKVLDDNSPLNSLGKKADSFMQQLDKKYAKYNQKQKEVYANANR